MYPRLSASGLRGAQREHEWQLAGGAGRQHEAAAAGLGLDQEIGRPVEVGVLVERLDAQARVDERGDDLAEAVVPAVLRLLADVGRRVGVRALDLEHERLAVLPVRIGEAQLTGRDALVLEDAARPGGSR